MSISYTHFPNIHPMKTEMFQKFCISYYLHIMKTNRRFSDNMVNYCWILFFVVIVSAIPLRLLSATLHFFQYLIKRESYYIGLVFFPVWEIIKNFVLKEKLGSTGGSLDCCMSSVFSHSFCFSMLNYSMYFIQSASKIQPDFVPLHLIRWW